MGDQLVQFYKEAEYLGGIRARMKLAALTNIPATEAAATLDSPAKIEMFVNGMSALAADMHGSQDLPEVQDSMTESSELTIERLRRNARAMTDMMGARALFLGDVSKTIARVTEALSYTLQVRRASVWFFDDAHEKIACADLFDLSTRQHTSGQELFAKDYAPYFSALAYERTIAAHDAHTDPRTAPFSSAYLRPLGITSMLDVPIWIESKMVGVVCNEHCGPSRTWIADDENIAFVMANFVALAHDVERLRKNVSPLRTLY